jgi:hypothetical protein
VTKVTQEKLKSTRYKWNCKSVEKIFCGIEKDQYDARIAELTKILYDDFCQRPKSFNHDLGIIQQTRIDTHE